MAVRNGLKICFQMSVQKKYVLVLKSHLTCGLEDSMVALAVPGCKRLHHSVDLLRFTRQSETPEKLPVCRAPIHRDIIHKSISRLHFNPKSKETTNCLLHEEMYLHSDIVFLTNSPLNSYYYNPIIYSIKSLHVRFCL